MEEDNSQFTDLIEMDRKTRGGQPWRGTFLEYLQKVKDDPQLSTLAHARLYDTVISEGWEELTQSEDPKIQRLFGDETLKVFHHFKKEFFGIERPIAQIVRYLHASALKGEEYRQALYLLGPVGAGRGVASLRSGGGSVHGDDTKLAPPTASVLKYNRALDGVGGVAFA